MQDIEVRIVDLAPMRVVSAYGFCESPEPVAWQRIKDWIARNGLADEIARHRFYGFNDPDPTPASPNYGYEQWMTLVDGWEPIDPEGGTVKSIPGGRYAVFRCRLVEIGESWQRLHAWVEAQGLRMGPHQWLEQVVSSIDDPPEDLLLDIHYPLAEEG